MDESYCRFNGNLAQCIRVGSIAMYEVSAVLTRLLGGEPPRMKSAAKLEYSKDGIADHVNVNVVNLQARGHLLGFGRERGGLSQVYLHYKHNAFLHSSQLCRENWSAVKLAIKPTTLVSHGTDGGDDDHGVDVKKIYLFLFRLYERM